MSDTNIEYTELPLGQTAQKGHCGSCKFFGRRHEVPAYMDDVAYKYNAGGFCKMELPPQYQRRLNDGESAPTNWINDTSKCDLWKSDGKVYVERRIVI